MQDFNMDNLTEKQKEKILIELLKQKDSKALNNIIEMEQKYSVKNKNLYQLCRMLIQLYSNQNDIDFDEEGNIQNKILLAIDNKVINGFDFHDNVYFETYNADEDISGSNDTLSLRTRYGYFIINNVKVTLVANSGYIFINDKNKRKEFIEKVMNFLEKEGFNRNIKIVFRDNSLM